MPVRRTILLGGLALVVAVLASVLVVRDDTGSSARVSLPAAQTASPVLIAVPAAVPASTFGACV